MMPGRTLHRLAALMCCAKTLERIVEPAIADLQKEYAGGGRTTRRMWVLVSGYSAVVKIIVVCALSVSSTTHDERRVLVRMLAWSVGCIAAISVLLTLPPLVEMAMRRWDAAIALVPQALPLAIPIGIAIGIAFGLSARPGMNIVKVTVIGAVVACALSFVVLAWVMPAANHAFREVMIRELADRGTKVTFGPEKGHNEMTLSELRHEEASFAAAGQIHPPRQFAFSFHLRIALAVAPLTLACLLLAAPFRHRGLRGLIAFAACSLYWALLYTGEALAVDGPIVPGVAATLPPFIGAWLPNIVIGAFAIGIASSRSWWLRRSLDPAA